MFRNYQLPEGKRIQIYKSGDTHYPGATMVVNPMQIKDLDNFLSTVTTKVDPSWGAVRSIHTPQRGTVIESLDSLSREGHYVAAGPKGFISIPGGYENIGKPGPKKKSYANHKPIHRPGLKNEVYNVRVYKNGDSELAVPFKFSKSDFANWDQALYRLSEKVRLPQGPVKRIYHLNGKIVKAPVDLVNNGTYVVAASNETFRSVSYGETSSLETYNTTGSKGSSVRPYKPPSVGRRSSDEARPLDNDTKGSIKLQHRRRTASKKFDEDEGEKHSGYRSNLSTGRSSVRVGGTGAKGRRNSDDGSKDRGGDAQGRNTARSRQDARWRKPPRIVSSKLQNRSKPSSRRSSAAHDRSRAGTAKPNAARINTQGITSRQSTRAGSTDTDDNPRNSKYYQRRNPYSRVQSAIPGQIPENNELGSVDYLNLQRRSRQNTPQQSPIGTPVHSRPSSPQNMFEYRSRTNSVYSLHEPIVEESEEEDRPSTTEDLPSERGALSRLSLIDSGHASLLSDEDRPDSVFRAKARSRPVTQAREVDYDTDDGGIFRSKSKSEYARGAKEILDSSVTNIEIPVDLIDAAEVQEEVYVS